MRPADLTPADLDRLEDAARKAQAADPHTDDWMTAWANLSDAAFDEDTVLALVALARVGLACSGHERIRYRCADCGDARQPRRRALPLLRAEAPRRAGAGVAMTTDDLERLLAAAHAAPPPTARGYDRWDQERREATQEILRVFPELLARLRAAEAALEGMQVALKRACEIANVFVVTRPSMFDIDNINADINPKVEYAQATLARLRAPLGEEK